MKMTFALYFGNRGFFPGKLIAGAREELKRAVEKAGYGYICMDEAETRCGAVETIAEGKLYNKFLNENRGKYDGVIVCLPNFGDENGVSAALKDVAVPILIQAYPDDIGMMDITHRRDAMCGKFAVCNILRQAGIPYTLTKKFTVSPESESFGEDLQRFAAICRVVKGMRTFNVGAIGARTTPFKTVRADEAALQRKGINVETVDLSEVFRRMDRVSEGDVDMACDKILSYMEFSGYPEEKLIRLAQLQCVLEDIIEEYDLQAVALRCWNEIEINLGIAPCASLSLLNEMDVAAACEVDITNAVMMRALSLAADAPSALLDFNNNYGDDAEKAIMFHCGPIPPSMLKGKGRISNHSILENSLGNGTGVGINKGEIKEGLITVGSIKTENGKIYGFVTEAEFTNDEIEPAFFGCGKVMKRKNIDSVANFMATNGYKHHLCVVFENYADVIKEAFKTYLGYEVEEVL